MAQNYLSQFERYGDELPTEAGLCVVLNITPKVLNEWRNDHTEFSDFLDMLSCKQEQILINKGLNKEFNPVIAKLLLSKHGYTEKTQHDVTSADESIKPSLDVTKLSTDALRELLHASHQPH